MSEAIPPLPQGWTPADIIKMAQEITRRQSVESEDTEFASPTRSPLGSGDVSSLWFLVSLCIYVYR